MDITINISKMLFKIASWFFSRELFDLLESTSWNYLVKAKLKPVKIIISGHQRDMEMYELHFYKYDREELDRLIEVS